MTASELHAPHHPPRFPIQNKPCIRMIFEYHGYDLKKINKTKNRSKSNENGGEIISTWWF